MFKRILVVVSGADPQQPAVRRAALLATKDTRLTVLDIVHEPLLDGYLGNTAIYEPLRERVVAERRGRIEALAAALESRGLTAAGKAVWDHPLEEAVAKYARALEADLVTVAPRGSGDGLTHSDWRMIVSCPVPVLIVKGDAERTYGSVVAAIDPFHSHAKPAELDLTILEYARGLSNHFGTKLDAVHCRTPVEYFADFPVPEAFSPEARRSAVEQLLERAGLPVSSASVRSGAPHEVLHEMAQRGEADVIVMGVIARGRLKDWLIGSTAERVLHGTRADVLAVKPATVS